MFTHEQFLEWNKDIIAKLYEMWGGDNFIDSITEEKYNNFVSKIPEGTLPEHIPSYESYKHSASAGVITNIEQLEAFARKHYDESKQFMFAVTYFWRDNAFFVPISMGILFQPPIEPSEQPEWDQEAYYRFVEEHQAKEEKLRNTRMIDIVADYDPPRL